LKSWLKGGLIVASIPIVLMLLSALTYLVFGKTSDMGNMFDWALIFATFYAFLLQGFFGSSVNLFERIVFKIVMVFPYFLIGALIGWVIGKRKSNR